MSNPPTVRVLCGGCQKLFTPTGLGSHLAQTTNPDYGITGYSTPPLPDEPAVALQNPVEERFVTKPHITQFGGLAGALIRTELPAYAQHSEQIPESAENPWAPLASRVDWEIAKWAKLHGSMSTAFTDLLSIDGVPEALGLSYKNSWRPTFKRQEIVVGGEAFDMYFHPAVECIKALYSDPEFAQDPKIIEKRCPGATIVPVMILTDKTQTAMFRNKAAYPVYMTIGNIPKDTRCKPSRQAYILLGYLPTTHLDHIKNKAAQRCAVANLYHACMRQILCLLKSAGLDGIEMKSGDGVVWCCHPIFAVFAGDYPEQVLVTGTKTVLEALKKADGNATEFTRACVRAGIKLIYHPFWEELPYVNIFLSITSDVLHQLYQGVIKHVVAWVTEAFGPIEIDARCQQMPPNHNTRLFLKGITTLLHVSGTEHDQMCCILLGLIVDLRLPDRHLTLRLIRAVRAALDFLYLAQYPMHSSETLSLLQDALEHFHENKENFDRSQEVGFSRKHHSSEGCATVWGGAEMREGPEWRRRATGSRPEARGSTRGGPEMNQKTGNGLEVRGTTGGGPERRSNEEEDIRGY
ncbi:hypothetical protein B0H10DRAFT_1950909 [Mycena sp. CBHHK59/15]|nr:hypothetical protein B0H10DRAFT_1950909 [Mycena sp. CBHHK59/15]